MALTPKCGRPTATTLMKPILNFWRFNVEERRAMVLEGAVVAIIVVDAAGAEGAADAVDNLNLSQNVRIL